MSYYEVYGSGHPLLLFAPGGLRSQLDSVYLWAGPPSVSTDQAQASAISRTTGEEIDRLFAACARAARLKRPSGWGGAILGYVAGDMILDDEALHSLLVASAK